MVEVVFADGTAGATYQLHAGGNEVGMRTVQALVGVAETQSTILAVLEDEGPPPTFVAIDRTTGAMAPYLPASYAYGFSSVRARVTDFVEFSNAPDRPEGPQGPGLVVIDAQPR